MIFRRNIFGRISCFYRSTDFREVLISSFLRGYNQLIKNQFESLSGNIMSSKPPNASYFQSCFPTNNDKMLSTKQRFEQKLVKLAQINSARPMKLQKLIVIVMIYNLSVLSFADFFADFLSQI